MPRQPLATKPTAIIAAIQTRHLKFHHPLETNTTSNASVRIVSKLKRSTLNCHQATTVCTHDESELLELVTAVHWNVNDHTRKREGNLGSNAMSQNGYVDVVVCCLLFVVCCSLFVVCWLLVVGCWLLVLFFSFFCFFWFVCSEFVACSS